MMKGHMSGKGMGCCPMMKGHECDKSKEGCAMKNKQGGCEKAEIEGLRREEGTEVAFLPSPPVEAGNRFLDRFPVLFLFPRRNFKSM